MKDIALVTLHGMGNIKKEYFKDLETNLRERLGSTWNRVAFHPVQYGDIMQGPQNDLWDDMISTGNNKLDQITLRKFLLFSFGDAGSLEHSAQVNDGKYRDIQRRIRDTLDLAWQSLGRDKTKPIIVIANSLGAQVISNYIWDAQNDNHLFSDADDSESADHMHFRKLDTLDSLYTTGSNMPLFSAGIKDRLCFKKPHNDFRWINYYDPDDILGWPLRQLGASYSIIEDKRVNVGNWFTSWNPMSHTAYWTDNDFIRPLANTIKEKLSKQ